MIALLSTLVGFISSAAPEFIRMFTDSRDRSHEIALLKLQMAYEEKNLGRERAARLEEIQLAAATRESELLNARPGTAANVTGIHWVDALAGSVRPVLTYAFFLLYFLVKCGQYHVMMSPALPWLSSMSAAEALVSLWTEEDIAIFSAVIGFWFGNRTMLKARASR